MCASARLCSRPRTSSFSISPAATITSPSSRNWASPPPTAQREVGTIQYRALGYPDRKYTVILMGDDTSTERYIGVVDENWKPIHSVELHTGGTTLSLLRSLKRF